MDSEVVEKCMGSDTANPMHMLCVIKVSIHYFSNRSNFYIFFG